VPDVQAHLDQLDQVLGQQVAGLTAIRNWLPRKIELIKLHRLADLEAFNQREEEQVVRLQQAESQRKVLLDLIARELGLAAPPSLAELAALVPGGDARLRVRRDQLSAVAAQIKDGQVKADALLRVSIDFVHHSMDVFAELAVARPPSGYGDDLSTPPPSGSFLLNAKA
jgi:hypothetical protein